MLECRNLTKRFGGLVAVSGVDLRVDENTITGVIGPNGSGKSTLVNLVSGLYTPDSGEILFKGKRISGMKPYSIMRLGLGRTFQLARVFKRLSILDNLLVPMARSRIDDAEIEKAMGLLDFFKLTRLRDEFAGNVSYGQQRLVELATVLMTDPELVLLDEPFAGINPNMIVSISESLKKLRSEGTTFLLIEHNVAAIEDLTDFLVVLDGGEKITEGNPREVLRDQRVIDAYLGG